MCLAIPGKVIKIEEEKAIVKQGDRTHEVDLCLLKNRNIKVGDYLLAHANLALNKLTDKEAKEIIKLATNIRRNHRNSINHYYHR